MAAVGYTDEEKRSAIDCGTKKMHSASLTLQNVVFDRKLTYSELESPADDEIVKCIARWNSDRFPNASHMNKAANNIANLLHQATAASSLNLQDHCERRILRIGRAGSTESVAATSGGESCQSSGIASDSASEPSSPSRPVTPQPMPPVPAHLAIDHCHYECLRADSEDSGFGPSPAKSSMGPSSPLDSGGFSVSPIQFVPEDDDEEDLEDDDDELSPDGPATSLLDLTTSRKSYFTTGVVVSDHEDIGCPKGFFPYSVSKLANSSDEFQEKDTIVQQNSDLDSSDDGFRFCLPCDSDSVADSNTAIPSPQTDDNLVVEQEVSDFQFLMTSASRDGCPPSDSNFSAVTNTSPCVALTAHQTLSELSLSSTSTVASLQQCVESKVGDRDAEDSVVSSLTADSSSCVQDDVSFGHRTTEDVTCSSLLASTDANQPLEEVPLVRIKVETMEDDENKCQSSTTHDDTTTFLDPKFVLGRNPKRAEEAIGVVVDPCYESSQELTRSELCRELTGECTSSSCSQATTATDSQSTISTSSADDNTCKWLNCDQRADANVNSSDLVDHLRECHVQTQFDDSGSYVCLWVGCKVYERPSSSRSWLERHVLLHGGSKPFRCIVDGCRQRFGTEGALQRHVNSHFPQNPSSSSARNAHGGKNGHHHGEGHFHYHCCGILCSGPNGRLLKRKRQQKCRRRPHSVKTNDFFDDGIMEQVRHSLFELSSIEGMDRGGPPAAITFHGTVIARRTEGSGKTKVLLHWDPEDLLPDSWVSEEDTPYSLVKTIPICSLPPETLVNLDPVYSARLLPRPGKRRRK